MSILLNTSVKKKLLYHLQSNKTTIFKSQSKISERKLKMNRYESMMSTPIHGILIRVRFQSPFSQHPEIKCPPGDSRCRCVSSIRHRGGRSVRSVTPFSAASNRVSPFRHITSMDGAHHWSENGIAGLSYVV